jgi:UDP-N-acetylmuramyl tripeptide synthase
MDEIDRAIAALKRHIEAATTDPEIAAVPLLVERIKRFALLLVPERGADNDSTALAAAVESLVTLHGYCNEATADPRVLEIHRRMLRDALVVVFGSTIGDDGQERTLADLPWTKQGQAKKAAESRWAGNHTREAVAWARDAIKSGEFPSRNAAAAAAALKFGAPYESIRKALKTPRPR